MSSAEQVEKEEFKLEAESGQAIQVEFGDGDGGDGDALFVAESQLGVSVDPRGGVSISVTGATPEATVELARAGVQIVRRIMIFRERRRWWSRLFGGRRIVLRGNK